MGPLHEKNTIVPSVTVPRYHPPRERVIVLNDHRIDHCLEQMEVSVPLAAFSERTNRHNLGTGAERHLGFGFGSIQY